MPKKKSPVQIEGFYMMKGGVEQPCIVYGYFNKDAGNAFGYGFNIADGGGWVADNDLTGDTVVVPVEFVEREQMDADRVVNSIYLNFDNTLKKEILQEMDEYNEWAEQNEMPLQDMQMLLTSMIIQQIKTRRQKRDEVQFIPEEIMQELYVDEEPICDGKCCSCAFWAASSSKTELPFPSECRREPPRLVDKHFQAVFPKTYPNDWCSGYRPSQEIIRRTRDGMTLESAMACIRVAIGMSNRTQERISGIQTDDLITALDTVQRWFDVMSYGIREYSRFKEMYPKEYKTFEDKENENVGIRKTDGPE